MFLMKTDRKIKSSQKRHVKNSVSYLKWQHINYCHYICLVSWATDTMKSYSLSGVNNGYGRVLPTLNFRSWVYILYLIIHSKIILSQSPVQCSAVQCSAVQCSAVQCSAVQCSAVQCSAVQCSAVQCSAVQCSAVQCSAVLVEVSFTRLIGNVCSDEHCFMD